MIKLSSKLVIYLVGTHTQKLGSQTMLFVLKKTNIKTNGHQRILAFEINYQDWLIWWLDRPLNSTYWVPFSGVKSLWNSNTFEPWLKKTCSFSTSPGENTNNIKHLAALWWLKCNATFTAGWSAWVRQENGMSAGMFYVAPEAEHCDPEMFQLKNCAFWLVND